MDLFGPNIAHYAHDRENLDAYSEQALLNMLEAKARRLGRVRWQRGYLEFLFEDEADLGELRRVAQRLRSVKRNISRTEREIERLDRELRRRRLRLQLRVHRHQADTDAG